MIIFLTAIILYIAICGYVYRFQEVIIFRPPKDKAEEFLLPGYARHNVKIELNGSTQHGIFFKKVGSEKVLIYLYGNAGEMNHLEEKFEWFSDFVDSSIFVFNYPGYGQNNGKPSEKSIYDWLNPWMEHLQKEWNISNDEIMLWGHSLGGGVACEIATHHSVNAMVLEGTFSHLVEVAKKRYPLFPVGMLCNNHFNNKEKLPNIKCPILIMHSKEDEVISYNEFKIIKNLLESDRKNDFLTTKGSHRGTYQTSSNTIVKKFNEKFPQWTVKVDSEL